MRRMKRVLLLGSESDYGHRIVEGIDGFCGAHGEWEYYLGRDNSPESIRQAAIVIDQWKPDGIIAHIMSERMERFVKRSRLPTVNVTGAKERDLPLVICDSVAVGRIGARHFLENGFRNFAFAPLTPELSVHWRLEGFSGELAEAGHRCSVLEWRDSYWATNRQKMLRWLASLKKPLALMCAYDQIAQTVIFACRHLGLRVPDDVAVLGVGNYEFHCRILKPQLSSIDMNIRSIGHEAARVLSVMMNGGKAPSRPILIPPGKVIARQSTDVIAVEDADISAAIRYIRDHSHEPTSVKDLLRVVPISRKTMERRFEKLIGLTPAEEIARIHLEKAIGLLEGTDLAIPEVARRAGFSERMAFSRFFRRRMKMSPAQYRRRYRRGGNAVTDGVGLRQLGKIS